MYLGLMENFNWDYRSFGWVDKEWPLRRHGIDVLVMNDVQYRGESRTVSR